MGSTSALRLQLKLQRSTSPPSFLSGGTVRDYRGNSDVTPSFGEKKALSKSCVEVVASCPGDKSEGSEVTARPPPSQVLLKQTFWREKNQNFKYTRAPVPKSDRAFGQTFPGLWGFWKWVILFCVQRWFLYCTHEKQTHPNLLSLIFFFTINPKLTLIPSVGAVVQLPWRHVLTWPRRSGRGLRMTRS